MTREETIAELKRARSKWAYVLYDDLTNAIGDAIEILEKNEWDKAIDAVLEIIDKMLKQPYMKDISSIAALGALKGMVLSLRGGEQ